MTGNGQTARMIASQHGIFAGRYYSNERKEVRKVIRIYVPEADEDRPNPPQMVVYHWGPLRWACPTTIDEFVKWLKGRTT